ncbi:hypothetical protein GCM10010198_37100 [Nocardia seriolae]
MHAAHLVGSGLGGQVTGQQRMVHGAVGAAYVVEQRSQHDLGIRCETGLLAEIGRQARGDDAADLPPSPR